MADRETTITLSVRDNFSAQLRQFANQIDSAEKSTGSLAQAGAKNFGNLGKGIDGAVQNLTGFSLSTVSAAGAIGLLGAELKYSIDQAMESEKVMAGTESAIKATGGAAGLTADQVAMMAGKLSQMTGVEDEAIQSGQNMLLTFKNIKGEAQFDRATKALTDMAVAMNGGSLAGIDLKGSAIQLGKALNDPVAGISALTRVGVTFTEEQKNTIKAMMAVNDVAGAQTIILKELESEFGGAAEAAGHTTAGALAKLKNAGDNLAESFGSLLLPTLAGAADGLLNLANFEAASAVLFQKSTGIISEQEAALRLNAIAAGNLGAVFGGVTDPATSSLAAQTERLKDDQINLTTSTDTSNAAIDAWSASMMDAYPAAMDLADATFTEIGSVTALTVGMQGLTKEMIFQTASEGLSSDAKLQLALSMGMVNQEAIVAAEKIEALKQKYDANRDGVIDAKEATSGYLEELKKLRGEIDGLQDKTVKITVIQDVGTGEGYQLRTSDANANKQVLRAAGGPVSAGGTYKWNEPASQGEVLVPAGDGYVLNKHDAAQALANNGQSGGLTQSDILMLSSSIARAVRDGIMAAG